MTVLESISAPTKRPIISCASSYAPSGDSSRRRQLKTPPGSLRGFRAVLIERRDTPLQTPSGGRFAQPGGRTVIERQRLQQRRQYYLPRLIGDLQSIERGARRLRPGEIDRLVRRRHGVLHGREQAQWSGVARLSAADEVAQHWDREPGHCAAMNHARSDAERREVGIGFLV